MSFNFRQPFEKVSLPSMGQTNGIKNSINYRILTAVLLSLIALPILMLSSCSKKDVNQNIHVNNQKLNSIIPPSQTTNLPAHTYQPQSQVRFQSQNKAPLQTIDTLEYYNKNYYSADDRIQLSKKVAMFIKHPPLKSNPRMYKRFHSAKSNFYKVRKYRKKLDEMLNKYKGRNNQLINVETKRQYFYEMEAELFYQLEKMVYYAEQSYLEWQIFKSHDAVQLSRFERNAIHQSENAAELFEDFSYAVTSYTGVSR